MKGEQVIAASRGRLRGAEESTVFVSGTRRAGSLAWERLRLHVVDRTGESCVVLPEDAGYDPSLKIGSFRGGERQEALVTVQSGGSGGAAFYTLYGYDEGVLKTLFSSAGYEAAFRYDVTYIDGFAARVASLGNARAYLVDLRLKGKAYLEPLYTAEGTLKAPQKGFVGPLALLLPIDLNGDGVLELAAFQRVSGLYRADALGDVVNVLSWNGAHFALDEQFVGVFGAPFTDP